MLPNFLQNTINVMITTCFKQESALDQYCLLRLVGLPASNQDKVVYISFPLKNLSVEMPGIEMWDLLNAKPVIYNRTRDLLLQGFKRVLHNLKEARVCNLLIRTGKGSLHVYWQFILYFMNAGIEQHGQAGVFMPRFLCCQEGFGKPRLATGC